MMTHDFENFPELTNGQLAYYYFESPHKQITEDFTAEVIRVIDGDTIVLRWPERVFDFPLRFSNIAAPELGEDGGAESQQWLNNRLLGRKITVHINTKNRVEKWGRLLGTILLGGIDIGLESVLKGHSTRWSERNLGKIEYRIRKI